MGKPTGFLEFKRELPADRGPMERIKDWDEFHERLKRRFPNVDFVFPTSEEEQKRDIRDADAYSGYPTREVFLAADSDTDDLTAGAFERPDLQDRVFGAGSGTCAHRLDADRRIPADSDIAVTDLSRPSSLRLSVHPVSPSIAGPATLTSPSRLV